MQFSVSGVCITYAGNTRHHDKRVLDLGRLALGLVNIGLRLVEDVLLRSVRLARSGDHLWGCIYAISGEMDKCYSVMRELIVATQSLES